jgi:hypothetical protein
MLHIDRTVFVKYQNSLRGYLPCNFQDNSH